MYLCETELFKIELFICIKMDLALNNLQRLVYHKTTTIELFICIKMDLALNNLQSLICHSTKSNETKSFISFYSFAFTQLKDFKFEN